MRQSATRERYDQSASTLLSWAANYRQDNQDQPKPPIVDKDTPRIQGEQIDSISFIDDFPLFWLTVCFQDDCTVLKALSLHG